MIDPIRKTLTNFPKRYIARSSVVFFSLVINSWAIASFTPAHQKNSEKTQLSLNDLSLSFVIPKPAKPVGQPTHKVIIKTTKEMVKPKPAQQSTSKNSLVSKTHIDLEAISEPKEKLVDTQTELTRLYLDMQNPEQEQTPNPEMGSSLSMGTKPVNPLVNNPSFAAPPKPPRYPSLARKRGQEGVVWLEVWLDELGVQNKLMVAESSGVSALDKAAVKAVSQWAFQAHRYDGATIASRIRIPVEFVLN